MQMQIAALQAELSVCKGSMAELTAQVATLCAEKDGALQQLEGAMGANTETQVGVVCNMYHNNSHNYTA
jgi:hypothetical protein